MLLSTGMKALSSRQVAPANTSAGYCVQVLMVETMRLVVFLNSQALSSSTSSITLKPPLLQTFIFFCAYMVLPSTLFRYSWTEVSGGSTTGVALSRSYPVDTYWQFMKEYLDSTLRQTLLLTQEFMLCLCDIISVSKNCSTDSLKISSTVFVTMGKNWSGPQAKCRLTISDSMSCPTKSPSMLTMDLSLVSISTVKRWARSPLGQGMKLWSMPTMKLPLLCTAWLESTLRQKSYCRRPYSLSATFLKEKPMKRKMTARRREMAMLMMSSFHLSFIQMLQQAKRCNLK